MVHRHVYFVFEEVRKDGLFFVCTYQRRNLYVLAHKNVLNFFFRWGEFSLSVPKKPRWPVR